ncbi:H-2 class II histocompatibility antigen, E-S beta chain-like [Alligator mississippiensis]|uniref:H-2 class II histocompatibility antigen, E-S beta chain-like n=1 Tax=Alligator mississippiensis TaxID=8496 RepID=UPI0028773A93|nr:H-2 class II histocompatibility antigen, E-S beta chain-like [Alligator mississippiensis]
MTEGTLDTLESLEGRVEDLEEEVHQPHTIRAHEGYIDGYCQTLLWKKDEEAKKMEEHFIEQEKWDCLYTNGTQHVRFLFRFIWNQEQDAHFDSDVGVFVADRELGEPDVKYLNSQKEELENARGEVDRFCRHNYRDCFGWRVAVGPGPGGRLRSIHQCLRSELPALETSPCKELCPRPAVKPKVKVSPTKSGAQAHPDTLICSVTGFYPGGIEVKWLKNGQEQTAGVVSTELMQNGDWTFQILVMLEMTPRSGDVYTCQVEHSSLPGPVTVLWEAQSDSARSKMLTGVGGFVLGLIFLALGLLVYLRNKKGRPVPQPTGLLS